MRESINKGGMLLKFSFSLGLGPGPSILIIQVSWAISPKLKFVLKCIF